MNGFLVASDSYVLIRWLFLRFFGLVYLIAFTSLEVQITGLIGEKGVLPAGQFLKRVRHAVGKSGFFLYPTLIWFGAKDNILRGICLFGGLLSLLLIFGVQTTPVLLLLWILYLSMVVAGQVFLSFQWDVLLVEAGFMAIFLVPPSLLPGQALAPPSPLIIFLFIWLLFRLNFMSGLLKLLSGDPTWRNLTAMAYHYETQPLPTPLAWYLHQAPLQFQKISTFIALTIEIAAPLLFFLPDPFRQIGAGAIIFLQILILLTGNYAFFNWLTIILCLFLFHDTLLRPFIPAGVLAVIPAAVPGTYPAWGFIIPVILALFYLVLGLAFLLMRFDRNQKRLERLAGLIEVAQAWRLVNAYGLFTSMTTVHPEIDVEGSLDGETWQAYEFKYKIGDPHRHLPVVAPHQPRLDWQMWFAALSSYSTVPWFLHLVECLLEDSGPVLSLLKHNPFPGQPPKYIRAVLYDYQFTSAAERAKSGDPWKREKLGIYMPEASIAGEESGGLKST